MASLKCLFTVLLLRMTHGEDYRVQARCTFCKEAWDLRDQGCHIVNSSKNWYDGHHNIGGPDDDPQDHIGHRYFGYFDFRATSSVLFIQEYLIHEADPQSRQVVITISSCYFQESAKQNHFQVRIVIATGGTVGLAEWIIVDTHVLFNYVFN